MADIFSVRQLKSITFNQWLLLRRMQPILLCHWLLIYHLLKYQMRGEIAFVCWKRRIIYINIKDNLFSINSLQIQGIKRWFRINHTYLPLAHSNLLRVLLPRRKSVIDTFIVTQKSSDDKNYSIALRILYKDAFLWRSNTSTKVSFALNKDSEMSLHSRVCVSAICRREITWFNSCSLLSCTRGSTDGRNCDSAQEPDCYFFGSLREILRERPTRI